MESASGNRKLAVRKPLPEDVERLCEMIQSSTCGLSKVTSESLHRDLFCHSEMLKQYGQQEDVLLLSIHQVENSNKPVCQAFVVQDGPSLVGYVMYHYYYSPWDGHILFLDDIYVEREFRLKGIASQLMQEVLRVCTVDRIKMILFNGSNVDAGLIEAVKRYRETKPIRNEQSDWSVYRINFTQTQ